MNLERGEEAGLVSEVPHFRIPEPVGEMGAGSWDHRLRGLKKDNRVGTVLFKAVNEGR